MIAKAFAEVKCIKGLGPLGNFCDDVRNQTGVAAGETILGQIGNIISRLIGIVTIVAFLWFLMQFITASFGWLTSGGDTAKLEEARGKIINAGMGLLLIVGTMAIMGLVQSFFGINFLDLTNFAEPFINPDAQPAQ